jgi:TolB-like protein/DNA-binding winged helix-turn-helix (wHTH) protein/Tfp pilus assembly protein PilF
LSDNVERGSFAFGEFRLDGRQRLLLRNGTLVALAPKAVDLLTELLSHHGAVLTKDELLQQVWAGTFVEEANLAQTISVLRKALGQTDDNVYIETIPKRGYRFVHPVKTGIPNAPAPQVEHVESPETGMSRRRWITAGALVLSVGLPGAYWSFRRLRGRPDSLNSIAVLPFVNISGDTANDYFADGLADELTHALTRVRGLQVVSRTSSFQFKNQPMDAREIGRRLQVSALLEGSVRNAGDRVRVTVQLIDAQSGRESWSESYDTDLDDILSVENRIAASIADKLSLNAPAPQQSSLANNGDPETYRLYLFGRYFWNLQTEDGLIKAIGYFEQAIQRNPRYALAYSGLADAWHRLVWNGMRSPHEGYPNARVAAERATSLDPGLPEARTSLANIYFLYGWDWPQTEREIETALNLNPANPAAHHLASHYYTAMGQKQRSLVESQVGLRLDPTSVSLNSHLAWHHYFARQYDAASVQARKALEIEPAFAEAHAILGSALAQAGRVGESVIALKDAVRYAPGIPSRLATLGWAYAKSGDTHEANSALAELDATRQKRYVSSFDLALVYIALGSPARALQLLGSAYEEKAIGLVNLTVDPALDPLRGTPEFQQLVRKLGLQTK